MANSIQLQPRIPPTEVRRKIEEAFRRCYSTVAAAFYVGVTPQLLAAWRKRGVGPGFARLPSGFGRNRAEKAGGVIVYPIEELADFVDRTTVAAGRLPRPTPGRLHRPALAQAQPTSTCFHAFPVPKLRTIPRSRNRIIA